MAILSAVIRTLQGWRVRIAPTLHRNLSSSRFGIDHDGGDLLGRGDVEAGLRLCLIGTAILAEPQMIAVWVSYGVLPHAPRFSFKRGNDLHAVLLMTCV